MKSEAPRGKPKGIFAELRRSHNDEPAVAKAMAGRLAIHPRGKPRGTLAKARRWLIPVLVAVTIGVLAYGLTRWVACNRCDPSPNRLESVSFLRRELGLTETQAREIRQLQVSFGAKLTDCCERHCAARMRLGKALGSETNGPAQAQAMITEMCRAYEASELATLEHIQRVRELLNLEQKRRFDELITECVCGSCAVCGGRVEADPKVRSND